ncbi:hypothetical protein [Burkholderia puraquae]|uniref:aromatic-ring hydroxylase C-terminal domain-containing protein n=1 Tax=Burkholderia puraquae TaxID=1904757 RepID=UPI001AD84095|nr:hypothetical protein [Burkholderia puraquae]
MGRSVPDFELADETRLGDHVRLDKGMLLDFDAGRPFQALANRWRDRIAYLASDAKDRLGLRAVLVRPDGCVAWAGDDASSVERRRSGARGDALVRQAMRRALNAVARRLKNPVYIADRYACMRAVEHAPDLIECSRHPPCRHLPN